MRRSSKSIGTLSASCARTIKRAISISNKCPSIHRTSHHQISTRTHSVLLTTTSLTTTFVKQNHPLPPLPSLHLRTQDVCRTTTLAFIATRLTGSVCFTVECRNTVDSMSLCDICLLKRMEQETGRYKRERYVWHSERDIQFSSICVAVWRSAGFASI